MFEGDPIGLPRRGLFSQIKVGFEEVSFLGIVALSVIGEVVGNYSPIISFWYWLTMMPVFAATAIITEWSRARAAGQSAMKVIWIQVAHWGGTVIALFATYSLWHVGRLGNEHTGLIVLLLLALTTFLDGYHVGWRFYLAGAAALRLHHRCGVAQVRDLARAPHRDPGRRLRPVLGQAPPPADASGDYWQLELRRCCAGPAGHRPDLNVGEGD